MRRDFNKQKEKLEKLEANQADQEKMSDLRSELDSSRKREQELESENASLKQELEVLQQRVKELEDALDSARQQIGETTVEQRINRELREELKKAEAKLIELTSTMEIVDTQCEQFRASLYCCDNSLDRFFELDAEFVPHQAANPSL
ncbi:unnamed protein product [Heligmosomoides polygyrus]|uniref:Uncharacterized protein n=1 Tax=Heligmosomoides polygyrus TaxID=6339 RepID=A0A3P7VLN8_HELPZ|nr:unnamed protein product [Heligmosomoides polygyrus]